METETDKCTRHQQDDDSMSDYICGIKLECAKAVVALRTERWNGKEDAQSQFNACITKLKSDLHREYTYWNELKLTRLSEWKQGVMRTYMKITILKPIVVAPLIEYTVAQLTEAFMEERQIQSEQKVSNFGYP